LGDKDEEVWGACPQRVSGAIFITEFCLVGDFLTASPCTQHHKVRKK